MDWLLILTMTFHGQTMTLPAGRMVDHQLCTIAGGGMKAILQAANPGLTVRFTCTEGAQA